MSNKTTISKDKSTALKGFLICLVVLGHNKFFTQIFSLGCFEWLYTFHVSAFFILPFFYSDHDFSFNRIWRYFKRLFWPYTYMFIILFLINSFLNNVIIDLGVIESYVTGNFYKLRYYTGFQYLWFLPAMFSMLCFKDIFTSSRKLIKVLILIIGALFFLFCWVFLYHSPYNKSINVHLFDFSVFSFMLGLSMFFLGSATSFLMKKKIHPLVCSFFLALSLLIILVAIDTPYYDYILWFSRTICPFMGFALLYNVDWYNNSLFRILGKFSLPIYIFHQPINTVICSVMQHISICSVMQLIVSFILVVSMTFLVTKVILSSERVRNVLFPRT